MSTSVESMQLARAYAALRHAERDVVAARRDETAAYERAEQTPQFYPSATLMALTGRRFAAELTRNRWRDRVVELETREAA